MVAAGLNDTVLVISALDEGEIRVVSEAILK